MRIGAQVSYRDLAGFGRRFLDVDPETLAAEILYQIGALRAFALAAGTDVAYVKPHGALYNTAVHHEAQAGAVVDAARAAGGAARAWGCPAARLLALAADAGLATDRGGVRRPRLHPRGHARAARRAGGAAARTPTRSSSGRSGSPATG